MFYLLLCLAFILNCTLAQNTTTDTNSTTVSTTNTTSTSNSTSSLPSPTFATLPFGTSKLCPEFAKRNLSWIPNIILSDVAHLDKLFDPDNIPMVYTQLDNMLLCDDFTQKHFVPRLQKTITCFSIQSDKAKGKLCQSTVDTWKASINGFLTNSNCSNNEGQARMKQFTSLFVIGKDGDCVDGYKNELGSCGFMKSSDKDSYCQSNSNDTCCSKNATAGNTSNSNEQNPMFPLFISTLILVALTCIMF